MLEIRALHTATFISDDFYLTEDIIPHGTFSLVKLIVASLDGEGEVKFSSNV